MDVVLIVVVLEHELGAPLAEAERCRWPSGRSARWLRKGLDLENEIDGEAAPVRPADADGDHGPVGVCAGVDVDVLLVDAPAWPVAAGAHRDAAAEVLGVICHAGVTAMPLPRSTNQSPMLPLRPFLRCFAMADVVAHAEIVEEGAAELEEAKDGLDLPGAAVGPVDGDRVGRAAVDRRSY